MVTQGCTSTSLSALCVCSWRVQLISVYSGNRLPRDLVVQLCDEAENPTPEENVRIQLTRDAAAVKVAILQLSDFTSATYFFLSILLFISYT